ncbi:MAG: hypothetical protein L6Q37_11055 [Bdellovibrionaceae bacterium]|nr:hypothetical protein [Pseudobdellovibrionaceae bacterium]NUM59290.1 hypothetical protein [Pseudobdellovibrionaceae bacterium]
MDQINQLVIFGQRGVGKTSFLNRLKHYWKHSEFKFLDLDQEIEKLTGKTNSEIFANEGEAAFRKYEWDIFNSLINNHNKLVLTLGGGFPVEKIPKEIYCLWLQRFSDESGRIFTDRPRLNPELTDLEEFLLRSKTRAIQFRKRADEIYFVSEGLDYPNTIEENIFNSKFLFQNFYLTLSEENYEHKLFLKKIGMSGFELRDDLLSHEKMYDLIKLLSPQHLILSFRDIKQAKKSFEVFDHIRLQCSSFSKNHIFIDWAIELGPPDLTSSLKPNTISLHEFLPGEGLDLFLKRLENYTHNFSAALSRPHLKASPVISTWKELIMLWEWQRKDPLNRSILPRSPNGQWSWFRQLMSLKQKINFWKVSQGSAFDQPTLYQTQALPQKISTWAALLGKPVAHSKTPIEQQSFFHFYKMPIFAIELSEEDFSLAIPFLFQLGLRAAAVTSPLKLKAFQLVTENHHELMRQTTTENVPALNPEALEFKSINTLILTTNSEKPNGFEVIGTNTDVDGFAKSVEFIEEKNSIRIAIWGGGGTLPIIKKILPHSIEFSVRSGKERDSKEILKNPEILIWAAAPDAEPPSDFIKDPTLVIDLNYKESSLARAYAKSIKAKYISGNLMFKEQAKKQREFWLPLSHLFTTNK